MKQKLTAFLYKFKRFFKVHQAFVTIIGMLLVIIAVVIRLNMLGNMEPNQAYVDDETTKIKTVQFDQEALGEIQALRESHVTVPGTQLPEGRQNPFSE